MRLTAGGPVHNDFHETRGLFSLFEGMEVPDMDRAFEGKAETMANGVAPERLPN